MERIRRFMGRQTKGEVSQDTVSPEKPKQTPRIPDQAKDEARLLLDKLRSLPGNSALILVIDDSRHKRETIVEKFEEEIKKREQGHVVATYGDAQTAINLYLALKQAEETEGSRHSRVVLVVDGDLAGPGAHSAVIKTGLDALKKISEVTIDNGWAMPQIVGVSRDYVLNDGLQRAYPESNLGNMDFESSLDAQRILDEIDRRNGTNDLALS